MFVVLTGSVAHHAGVRSGPDRGRRGTSAFTLQLAVWLWFTVLFANFAEAMAEGRGKAQADTLRGTRHRDPRQAAARSAPTTSISSRSSRPSSASAIVSSSKAGDLIPADGEVVEGIASVDEAAITGESAPVIREAGGDRSAVTGGTRVLSDWIVVRVTANPGETFVDRMIALVEGATRRRTTPNEIALTILLSGLTIVLLLAVIMLKPFAAYSGDRRSACRSWSRFSFASFPPPSADSSPPSASRGWTA